MVCVRDVHHFGEVVLDAHWHCSREDHVVVQREEEVVHVRRALDHVDVLVVVHDDHDVLVSILRCFLNFKLSLSQSSLLARLWQLPPSMMTLMDFPLIPALVWNKLHLWSSST